MGVEDIIARIKQDAHQRADTEVADARKEAAQYRKKFEHELEKMKESLQRDMEDAIRARAAIVVSDARRRSRDSLLTVKESIIQECINEALLTLRDLHEDRNRQLLLDLITRAREQVGEDCIVAFTSSRDRELLSAAQDAQDRTPGFRVSDEIVPGSGGVMVFSADRRLRVNNTFEGILQRKRGEIRNMAARMLFS